MEVSLAAAQELGGVARSVPAPPASPALPVLPLRSLLVVLPLLALLMAPTVPMAGGAIERPLAASARW